LNSYLVSPWNNLMTMRHTNAKRSDGDHFVFRIIERGVIKFSLDNMNIIGNCFQIIKHLLHNVDTRRESIRREEKKKKMSNKNDKNEPCSTDCQSK
jgi:hypothetical protein